MAVGMRSQTSLWIKYVLFHTKEHFMEPIEDSSR